MRERDKAVMIPGFEAWATGYLVVPFTHIGNIERGPGLAARVRREDEEICSAVAG